MLYIIAKTENIQSVYDCKVGVSKNPSRRLKQLQTGNESKLVILQTFECNYGLDYQIETSLKNVFFKKYSILNEWYQLPSEAIDTFKELCTKIQTNLRLINHIHQ